MSSQTMCISLGVAIVALAPIVAPAAGQPAMPPGFVDAATVVPGLRTDIRYAGPHNFTGEPVAGYEAPRCWLARQAADALAAVQADLAPRGLGLLAYDCYRPLRAVARFVDWAKTPGGEMGKREFYPDIAKGKLFADGYIAARSAHSRGSTVDLTLVERASGRPLEMGTPFDLFGPASQPDASGRRMRQAQIAPCWRRRWRGAALPATTRNGGTSHCAPSRIRLPVSTCP